MNLLQFRFATADDAAVVASMNQQLIRDEGHRNRMTLEELTRRMEGWLGGEYRAVLFESGGEAVGYALYRHEADHVYLRQLFVTPQHRRQGVARAALRWMWGHAWVGAPRLRIEVLVGNDGGRAFWRSVGFVEYCVTMEAPPPA